jgi:predicted nuclease of restriction endonuclease-like (RecB) superfamily
MEKLKDATVRQWYMRAAVENGWSRDLLQDHIAAASHRRAGLHVHGGDHPRSETRARTVCVGFVRRGSGWRWFF